MRGRGIERGEGGLWCVMELRHVQWIVGYRGGGDMNYEWQYPVGLHQVTDIRNV